MQINRIIPTYAKPGVFYFTPMSLSRRPQGDYFGTSAQVGSAVYVK